MALLPNSGLETHPSGVPSLNALINGNWNVLDSWANPATGLTAAQAGATVTASAVVFTSQNIGDKIRFASGEECTITATAGTVGTPSATCTVTPSRTVASAAINLFAPTTQSALTFLARAFTKKTKSADIVAGATLIWNATKQIFEPGGTEGSPLLYMNLRRTGTNAQLNNTSALQRIFGRDSQSAPILANTILANSELRFELRGNVARAAGTLTIDIAMGETAGVPIIDWTCPAVTPYATCVVIVKGYARFEGVTSAMNFYGIVTVEFIESGFTGNVKKFFCNGPGRTINMTIDQQFSILGQWSTANVGNTFNVESFSISRLTNAN